MKQRIEYFDTTKGILMFFLIWGHMIIFAKTLGIESDFTQTIQNTVPFYRAFFMQTFFFITGFCTSWNKPFKPFLIGNFKTIILPAFIFLPLAFLTNVIIGKECSLDAIVALVIKYLTDGIPWFLSALFFAKMIYWTMKKKYQSTIAEWIVIIALFLVGLVIKESTSLPNNWSYQHAMLMLPFLALGCLSKTINTDGLKFCGFEVWGGILLSNKILSILSLPYFGIIALWQIMGMGLGFPAVDAYLDIHYISAPFHLAFAVSGTALILLIAKKLQKCTALNLFGRQSLFVYLAHTFVVFCLMKLWQTAELPTASYMEGVIFYLSIYIISLLLLYMGCHLLERKAFGWMVGKF